MHGIDDDDDDDNSRPIFFQICATAVGRCRSVDSNYVLLQLVAVDRLIQLCATAVVRCRSVYSNYVLLHLVAVDRLIQIMCCYSWLL